MTLPQRLIIHDAAAPGRLTPALIEQLIAGLSANAEARVVTLEGHDGVFSEGFDLTALGESDTDERNSTLLARFGALLDAIAATRPPRDGVDLDDLASGLLAAYEGGFIIGRMLKDPHELARQLRNYRTLLEFSFAP